MSKIDESKESKKVHVVLGLENGTLEQRLVFQSFIAPAMLETLDQYAGLLAIAPDVVGLMKPIED